MRIRWRAEAGQSQKACPVQQREDAGTSPPDPLGERPPAPTLAPSDLDPPQRTATVIYGFVRRTLPAGPRL